MDIRYSLIIRAQTSAPHFHLYKMAALRVMRCRVVQVQCELFSFFASFFLFSKESGGSPLTLRPNFNCEKGNVTAAAAACMPRWGSFVVGNSKVKKASPERGDSPRGGEMPAGQRGPLSTRGTAVRRWRGFFVKSFYDVFGISGNPSVSATHCQLSTRHALRVPFQGSLTCQTS